MPHPCRNEPWYPSEVDKLPIAERFKNPLWFIPLLGIIDDQGRNNRLTNPHPEQLEIVNAMWRSDKVCVLKPRQIGCTTIVLAFVFWWMLVTRDPRAVLTITHESGAVGRCNQMLRKYWRSVPSALRGVLTPDNAKAIGLSTNGSLAMQVMAGGRGQARSNTFQMLHCTEMGFWPRGSAVLSGSNVDEDAFASAMSTLHGGRIVLESTGNGPVGVFYKMVKLARVSREWEFLFFPWTDFPEYSLDIDDGFEPTSEEEGLVSNFGLTWEQVAWRRFKLEVEGYSEQRFRKEYPLTWLEPFLMAEGMWFDTENLNRISAAIEVKGHRSVELNIFEQPRRGVKYFIGVDTSGGTGRDYSVIQVLSQDLRQVAVWRSNKSKPSIQADMAAKLSAKYNRARVLTERNGFGDAVIKRMSALGVYLWKGPKGKDFWTQGGNSRTKKAIYDWASELVDGNEVELLDHQTVSELSTIREKESGNIEADGGGHDDHADALCLAMWNARKQYSRVKNRRPLSLQERRKLRHKNPNLRIT